MEPLAAAGLFPMALGSAQVSTGPWVIVCSSCGRQCLGGDTWMALPVSPLGQIVPVLCPACSRAWARSHMAPTSGASLSQDDSD